MSRQQKPSRDQLRETVSYLTSSVPATAIPPQHCSGAESSNDSVAVNQIVGGSSMTHLQQPQPSRDSGPNYFTICGPDPKGSACNCCSDYRCAEAPTIFSASRTIAAPARSISFSVVCLETKKARENPGDVRSKRRPCSRKGARRPKRGAAATCALCGSVLPSH